ncbi:MAG: tetratricopeptide repeat protein [Nitrospira sp.]|nr:sel1 repeat family protein [Candidatus Manganitrophaceae bacterium]HIL35164.1 sel1 repeat family protein [Candidatus Manganitrophaceae bacterium]
MQNLAFLIFLLSFGSLFSCTVHPEIRNGPLLLRLQAAENGDAEAQYRLGLMYLNGEGVSQDLRQAAKWYRKSAENGNPDAQFGLGVLYFHGQGVPRDTRETAKWYRRAAEQGSTDGQLGLGLLYFLGKGVQQNDKDAYIWLDVAAAQGHTQAAVVREMIEKNLDPETLSQAKILSKEYHIKYVAPFNDPS